MNRQFGWFAAWVTVAIMGVITLPAFGTDTSPATPKSKTIELAICLDTSNSMDGLIDSAKRKLWDIVNDLAKAKPAPILRVALYSYGNDGYKPATGWVRKELDLTSDLDKVSEKLFALKTHGGTEYVGRVCRDALKEQRWSDDAGTLKLIFVCGNEPATQDPEISLKLLAETAARQGVIVNTIYCGNPDHPEAKGWKEFADLAEGRYVSIDQNRGTVAIATPMDKKLAELGVQLNSTYAFFGREARELKANQLAQDANALTLGAPAAAARAAGKGGALYRFEENDLVEKLKNDPKFDVRKVAEAELSEELRKMKPDERQKHVKDLLVKRETLQKQISELAKNRDAYIQAEAKKNPSGADQAFDEAVRGVLRDQAKNKGLVIPD